MVNKVATAMVRLGVADLEQRLHVDRSTIWRWYRVGKFPAPHYVGERRAWFLGEIEAWELQRMARPPEARLGARNFASGSGAAP